MKSIYETTPLQPELDEIGLLHRLRTDLSLQVSNIGICKKIVETAVAIMGSQYATMQMCYPDRGGNEKLRIVASHGFSPEAERYWEWVYHYTGSSCGEVLRTRRRVMVPDYRTCEFMQDAPTLPIFINGGIFAAQSTPLYSRTGKLLGMISTHWNHPYDPPQHHWDLLDILVRQAADLIERLEFADVLKEVS